MCHIKLDRGDLKEKKTYQVQRRDQLSKRRYEKLETDPAHLCRAKTDRNAGLPRWARGTSIGITPLRRGWPQQDNSSDTR